MSGIGLLGQALLSRRNDQMGKVYSATQRSLQVVVDNLHRNIAPGAQKFDDLKIALTSGRRPPNAGPSSLPKLYLAKASISNNPDVHSETRVRSSQLRYLEPSESSMRQGEGTRAKTPVSTETSTPTGQPRHTETLARAETPSIKKAPTEEEPFSLEASLQEETPVHPETPSQVESSVFSVMKVDARTSSEPPTNLEAPSHSASSPHPLSPSASNKVSPGIIGLGMLPPLKRKTKEKVPTPRKRRGSKTTSTRRKPEHRDALHGSQLHGNPSHSNLFGNVLMDKPSSTPSPTGKYESSPYQANIALPTLQTSFSRTQPSLDYMSFDQVPRFPYHAQLPVLGQSSPPYPQYHRFQSYQGVYGPTAPQTSPFTSHLGYDRSPGSWQSASGASWPSSYPQSLTSSSPDALTSPEQYPAYGGDFETSTSPVQQAGYGDGQNILTGTGGHAMFGQDTFTSPNQYGHYGDGHEVLASVEHDGAYGGSQEHGSVSQAEAPGFGDLKNDPPPYGS